MDEKPEEAKPKRRRRRWIPWAVVAAVVVAAGVGFWSWHETPQFCNAVCHDPMDAYAATYFEEGSACLASTHREAGLGCLDCHEAKIDEQVAEASAWLAHDFQTGDDGMLSARQVTADKEFCAKSGCHDFDQAVAATANWGGEPGVNPHESHQVPLNCSNCHGGHGESILYCNTCHDYKVPDGWNG